MNELCRYFSIAELILILRLFVLNELKQIPLQYIQNICVYSCLLSVFFSYFAFYYTIFIFYQTFIAHHFVL